MESFAAHYSMKRPSKKVKNKKQIAIDGLYGIIPDFAGPVKVDENDKGKDCVNYTAYKTKKFDHVRTILEE